MSNLEEISQMPIITCPVCDAPSQIVRDLPANFIKAKLCDFYGLDSLNSDLEISDYHLSLCTKCSLEFAYPLKPGSNAFYKWITSRDGYYPSHRWEWDIVIQQIQSRLPKDANLLEVGCGSGVFLDLLKSIPSLSIVGLDTTDTSVKSCQDKGLNVRCETLESYLATSGLEEKQDYIISFHCLEHVPNPKALVQSMATALKSTGSIFISTPYSPMSFETQWFDPLNHPPHHLIRWNAKAYQELGSQLGLSVKFYMPKPSSALSRTLRTLNYAWFGPANAKPTNRLMLSALGRPWALILELARQLQREKVSQQIVADTVLVEFTPIQT